MRFIVDEDNPPLIAAIGRGLGLDIVPVLDLERGGHGYSDVRQLRLAGQEGRCLITKDEGGFRSLSRQFQELGYAHAGVLIITHSLDRRNAAAIAHALVAHARLYPDGMPAYMVDYLHPAPSENESREMQ